MPDMSNMPMDPTPFTEIKAKAYTDVDNFKENSVSFDGHNFKPIGLFRLNSEGKVEERAKWSILGKLGNYVSTIFKKFEVLRDIKSTVNHLHNQVKEANNTFRKDTFKPPEKLENESVSSFNAKVDKYNEKVTTYNESIKNVKNQFNLFGRIIGFKGLLMKHRMSNVNSKLDKLKELPLALRLDQPGKKLNINLKHSVDVQKNTVGYHSVKEIVPEELANQVLINHEATSTEDLHAEKKTASSSDKLFSAEKKEVSDLPNTISNKLHLKRHIGGERTAGE